MRPASGGRCGGSVVSKTWWAVALLAIGAASCSSSDPPSGAPAPTHPNVVVFLVDDMDAMTMPLWDALPKTKAALADRGTTFTNAFAPDPLCCPARSTVLTGRYAHNTGVLADGVYGDGYAAFASGAQQDTVATRLQGAGYRTAFIGKYLNGYEKDPSAVPPGWDEWFGLAGSFLAGYGYGANHNGAMESYGTASSDYLTDVLARTSVSFLRDAETDDEQPFLLLVAPSAPHASIPPAPRHADNAFTDAGLPLRPSFNEADVSDKPEWLREGVPPLAEEDMQTEYRRMMGSLLAVDDLVADVVAQLQEADELDSTVLLFLSDNGFLFGAHRLGQKMAPYEESIRVPFVVAGPGVDHATSARMVSHADVMPTVLDLAGVPVPDSVDGRSLVPVLDGTVTDWRDDLLIEHNGTYSPYKMLHTLAQVRASIAGGAQMSVPTYRGLRTDSHLYVQWYAGDEHDYELYDLEADPGQLDNLLATPTGRAEHEALVAELQARLDELVDCSGTACR